MQNFKSIPPKKSEKIVLKINSQPAEKDSFNLMVNKKRSLMRERSHSQQ